MTKKQKTTLLTAIAASDSLPLPAPWDRAVFPDADPAPDAARCGIVPGAAAGSPAGNYLGYLAGALICIVLAPAPLRAIRWARRRRVVPLAMGGPMASCSGWRRDSWPPGECVRPGRGLGMGDAALAVAARRNGRTVFAGVGTGIAFAGLFGLAAGIEAWVRARAGSRSPDGGCAGRAAVRQLAMKGRTPRRWRRQSNA